MSLVPNKPTQLIVYGRLANASLFHPYQSKLGDKKESWKADIIINPNSSEGKKTLAEINNVLKEIGLSKWKKWPLTWPDPKRLCLRDGDMKVNQKDEVIDGFEGMKYLSTSRQTTKKDGTAQQPPGVYDAKAKPLHIGSTIPYNGCWVKAHVDFYGTENGGRGLFSGLISVQCIKEDEPLANGGGGSEPTASVFSDESEDSGDDV
jgi:hypothetical protein